MKFGIFQEFGLDKQDVAVLEYAYGLSEISTGIYKVNMTTPLFIRIQSGICCFRDPIVPGMTQHVSGSSIFLAH